MCIGVSFAASSAVARIDDIAKIYGWLQVVSWNAMIMVDWWTVFTTSAESRRKQVCKQHVVKKWYSTLSSVTRVRDAFRSAYDRHTHYLQNSKGYFSFFIVPRRAKESGETRRNVTSFLRARGTIRPFRVSSGVSSGFGGRINLKVWWWTSLP